MIRIKEVPPFQRKWPPMPQKESPTVKADDKKTVVSVLEEFIDMTSLGGVNYIHHAPGLLCKLIWAVFFLTMLLVSFWQLGIVGVLYYSYPYTTKYETLRDVMDFPSVTICNFNPIRNSQADRDPGLKRFLDGMKSGAAFKEVAKQQEAWKAHGPGNLDFGETSISSTKILEDTFYDTESKIPRKTRLEMGHQAKHIIRACTYNGYDCTHSDFTTWLSREYGNCFTFNAHQLRKKSLQTFQSDSSTGLRLVLYLQYDEALSGWVMGTGFRVELHPFGTLSLPSEKGLSIMTGTETFLDMKEVKSERLGHPYSYCHKSSYWSDLLGTKYDGAACLATCLDRLMIEKCNCYLQQRVDLLPDVIRDTFSPCDRNNTSVYACEKEVEALRNKKGTCKCADGCKSTDYIVTTSANHWPDVNMWNSLVSKLCKEPSLAKDCTGFKAKSNWTSFMKAQILKENFAALRIFYGELSYDNYYEEADYQVMQFFSDIGGTIGLWVGASIFTFIEIGDLLVKLAYHQLAAKLGKQRPK